MSNDGNRTVFQPSPLRDGATPSASVGGYPPSPPPAYPPPLPPSQPPVLAPDEDIPEPPVGAVHRNPMMAAAAPILALAAAIRSGRARQPLAQFHAQASRALATFDAAIAGHYPAETRQRATYALASTIDDIAQNLPGVGAEASEWARRSLVVLMFRENIGGDRFWQIVEDMLARPAGHDDLIELFHACLAAGFEGRFRVMADGRQRLSEISTRLFGALAGRQTVSERELVGRWRGLSAPLARVGGWDRAALAAAVAAAALLLIYCGFRLALAQSGAPAWTALAAINPSAPLRLTRGGTGLGPLPSGQAARLETFLAPEIAHKLVKVDRDAATVRVRTTVGQLFRSGSDELEPGRAALFGRIAAAVDKEPGPVSVEGYTDSDRPRGGLTFPDNAALSAARAETVAALIRAALGQPGRVTAEGKGEAQPVAANDTSAGKALNRRVEIVLQRHD